MILAFLLLFTGLTISGVAIYYSVIGLTAIFSAAAIPIMIMGSSLEVAKLVCASWLKANWDRVPRTMKWYMTAAVVVLMIITSMGIFGFLSKAHNDQNLVSGDVLSKIAIYDEKIKTEKENIEANRKALKQMDEAVDQVLGRSTDEKGADKAVNIRRSQQKERARLQNEISQSQKSIAELNDARAPIAAEVRKVEAEVGPIKYIAKFIYGEHGADENMLEKAVTWVIVLIVIVFDPLAVIMLLAAQMTYQWVKNPQEDKYDDFVAEAHEQTIDAMIEQEQEEEAQVSESQPNVTVSDTGLPETPPAYLSQPFVHFGNLKPMVAPKLEPEPKLETTPFDPIPGAEARTLIVDTNDVDRLQTELNESQSNVYELANYVQQLQNDYAIVSSLHQKSMSREADLIEEVAQLKATLDNQAAMSITPPEDIPGLEVREFTPEEVAALEANVRPISEFPELQSFIKQGLEDGSLSIQGSNDQAIEVDLGTLPLESVVFPEIQEDSAGEVELAPVSQPEQVEVQEEDTPDEVNKHTESVVEHNTDGEPAILKFGVDVVDRPGDYITDPLANLLAKREPTTGFGDTFPDNPERGDLYLRTDFRPTRLFKWNNVKWIEVNKATTDSYTYNDAYIQFLAEKLMTGEYTLDDLTETEQSQVQTVLGGRYGRF